MFSVLSVFLFVFVFVCFFVLCFVCICLPGLSMQRSFTVLSISALQHTLSLLSFKDMLLFNLSLSSRSRTSFEGQLLFCLSLPSSILCHFFKPVLAPFLTFLLFQSFLFLILFFFWIQTFSLLFFLFTRIFTRRRPAARRWRWPLAAAAFGGKCYVML